MTTNTPTRSTHWINMRCVGLALSPEMVFSIQQLKLICFQFLPVLLPLIPFLFFVNKWVQPKSASNKKLPPSPPRLPILGNLHQFGMYPHRSFRSLSEKYGELMLVYIGKSPLLIVSSAKAVREIMKTHDVIFSDRPSTKTGNKLMYNGKNVGAARYGEYWRQMKSILVLQLLSNTRVRSFRSVREEEMVLMMEKIEKSTSLPLDLSEMFMSFTNSVICRLAFGRKYSRKEGGTDFKRLLRELLELLGGFRIGDFIPWLSWTNWLDGWDAKVQRVANELDQFLEQVVREHEDRLRLCGHGKGEPGEEDEKFHDVVDVLLDVQKGAVEYPFDRDSIKATILDLFAGGTDTSYTVLEWGMTELIRHPTVMQQLQKEIRAVTGSRSYVNEDDIEKMKYLKAVIKETARLHPPLALLVPRLSTQDANINGYDIPARTAIIINAWAIHRDAAFWEEPEKFNPDRFLNSTTDFTGQDFQLIPFGGGRRICPGKSFAIANIELVLANMLHKFDWTLPGGANPETLDTDEFAGFTIHRKTPLCAVATAHTC